MDLVQQKGSWRKAVKACKGIPKPSDVKGRKLVCVALWRAVASPPHVHPTRSQINPNLSLLLNCCEGSAVSLLSCVCAVSCLFSFFFSFIFCAQSGLDITTLGYRARRTPGTCSVFDLGPNPVLACLVLHGKLLPVCTHWNSKHGAQFQ